MSLDPRIGESRRRRKHGQRTLDLPAHLVEELKSEASRLGRSLSSIVQMAWRISRGRPADLPPRLPPPWDAVAREVKLRLSTPAKQRSAARAWLKFETWCVEQGLSSCPALDETLFDYAKACLSTGANPKQVLRTAAAVSIVHRARGAKVPRLRPNARDAVKRLASSTTAIRQAR